MLKNAAFVWPNPICPFSSLYFSGLFTKYLLIYPLLDLLFKPPRDKTNKMACAPSEDSDQPGHPPSLIRVFAVRMKKAWTLSCPLSECPGWSESLLGAQPQYWFCHEAAHFSYLLFILSEFLQHNSTSVRIYDASSNDTSSTTTLRLKFRRMVTSIATLSNASLGRIFPLVSDAKINRRRHLIYCLCHMLFTWL